MRIIYILIFCALLSVILLWLGRFQRLSRRVAALLATLSMLLAGGLLLLAVLPYNSFYGEVITQGRTNAKRIALTFDDGPYPPYTQELLKTLAAKNVHATFFMVGENAARHPELVRAVQKEGHEIALHAGKHQDLLKLTQEQLKENISNGKSILTEITGASPRLMRPPHGFKDWQVMQAIHDAELTAVTWSVIPRDWTNPGAQRIAERVCFDAHPGAIVLLHDGDSPKQLAPREQTVQATALIIDRLRSEGYKFVTVGELLNEK